MSKRLDDLSQNLASGMSRRRALQIFAGSLVAAAFGRSAIDAVAAGEGKTVSNFCKYVCTPFFTGQGNRGLSANYYPNATYYGNYYGNYYANYSSYDQCMNDCHTCDPGIPNPCGSGICVQAEYPGQPLAIYCLPA